VQKLGKKKEKKRKKKKMIKINKKKDSDLMTYIDIDATDHVMLNNNSPPPEKCDKLFRNQKAITPKKLFFSFFLIIFWSRIRGNIKLINNINVIKMLTLAYSGV